MTLLENKNRSRKLFKDSVILTDRNAVNISMANLTYGSVYIANNILIVLITNLDSYLSNYLYITMNILSKISLNDFLSFDIYFEKHSLLYLKACLKYVKVYKIRPINTNIMI